MEITIILSILGTFHFVKAGVIGIKTYHEDNDALTEIGNANEFVDNLIGSIMTTYGHELDPYPLPDMSASFKKRPLFVTYSGEAKLHDGRLSGLCSLHRDGDCTMRNDSGLNAVVNLAMGVLKFDYKGTVTFMKIGPTVKLHGSIGYLSVHMVIKQTFDGKLFLKEFKVREIKGLEIKIRNLGILNPLLNLLTKAVTRLFKPNLIAILERNVKDMVSEKLKDFKLPRHTQ